MPRGDQLEFFGNGDAAKLFVMAVGSSRSLGAKIIEIDYAPFLAAARLLCELGGWRAYLAAV